MKEIRWNIGLMILRVGYTIRKRTWYIGVAILWAGHRLRGEVPQKHWFNYGKF